MAHNLAYDALSNETAMFCTGTKESAWHHLGQRIPECCTWEKAMELSHLDWAVEKKQLINPYNNEPINAWGTFRTDTSAFLGAVGSRYTPIQNIRMGEVLDTLVGNIGGAHYESAGALGNGERVWALVKLPEDIKVGNDISENYIMFANSHDGTSAGTIKLTSTRVVCQNTINIAMRDAGRFFRLGHYPTVDQKLIEVTNIIQGINGQIGSLNEIYNILAGKTISVSEFNMLLDALFPVKDEEESTRNKNKKDIVTSLFENNDDNAFLEQRGTFFAAFNAVTRYQDHFASVKGDAEANRAKSAVFGVGEAIKFATLLKIGQMAGIQSLVQSL